MKIYGVWGLGQLQNKILAPGRWADGQMVVEGRQEALCLFILASLGDETDRGNNLRVNKTFSFVNHLPLWAALPAAQWSMV